MTSENKSVSYSLIRSVRLVQVASRITLASTNRLNRQWEKWQPPLQRNTGGISHAVGIDVSKGKSTVAILRSHADVVVAPFDIPHTVPGMKHLLATIHAVGEDTVVFMEHTGRYYEPVAQTLCRYGVPVVAFNPLLLTGYGSNSLRNIKTDKADAKKIARYGLDYHVYMNAGGNKFLRRYYGKVRDDLATLDPPPPVESWSADEPTEVALQPLDCPAALTADSVKDATGAAKPLVLDGV